MPSSKAIKGDRMTISTSELPYGKLTKTQLRFIEEHSTDIFNVTFEELPRAPYPDSEEELRQEITLLRNASRYNLLDTEEMSLADTNLLEVFYCALNEVGLEFPEWTKSYVQALGTMTLKLKQEFQRPRPYQVAQLLDMDFEPEDTKSGHSPSYPSGHAVQATALALAFAQEFGPLLPWGDIAKKISYSRVQLGVHYPSDLAYGELIGDFLFRKSTIYVDKLLTK